MHHIIKHNVHDIVNPERDHTLLWYPAHIVFPQPLKKLRILVNDYIHILPTKSMPLCLQG